MIYYRCKCGNKEAVGSMPPYPCSGCEKCGTTLETNALSHRTPKPHDYETTHVDTDNGPQPVTRCRWCGKAKSVSPDAPEGGSHD